MAELNHELVESDRDTVAKELNQRIQALVKADPIASRLSGQIDVLGGIEKYLLESEEED